MIRGRVLVVGAFVCASIGALTACDTVTEASNALNRAELCTRAIAAAGFSPDLADPVGAVEEAQRKATELRELAGQTSDADLQRELQETADQIGSLQQSDVTPTDVVTWAAEKLEQANQLAVACG